MMNPVSAAHAVASYGFEAAPSKSTQKPQPASSFPQDKVSIKSNGGDADRDGDSK